VLDCSTLSNTDEHKIGEQLREMTVERARMNQPAIVVLDNAHVLFAPDQQEGFSVRAHLLAECLADLIHFLRRYRDRVALLIVCKDLASLPPTLRAVDCMASSIEIEPLNLDDRAAVRTTTLHQQHHPPSINRSVLTNSSRVGTVQCAATALSS